mmetsp:Transcript_26554/g.76735  ORF Transcript_26554/g.76735 Transcript_26554/m.76735 type:complete len:410 (-) Transcript_26554:126-1355(-)
MPLVSPLVVLEATHFLELRLVLDALELADGNLADLFVGVGAVACAGGDAAHDASAARLGGDALGRLLFEFPSWARSWQAVPHGVGVLVLLVPLPVWEIAPGVRHPCLTAHGVAELPEVLATIRPCAPGAVECVDHAEVHSEVEERLRWPHHDPELLEAGLAGGEVGAAPLEVRVPDDLVVQVPQHTGNVPHVLVLRSVVLVALHPVDVELHDWGFGGPEQQGIREDEGSRRRRAVHRGGRRRSPPVEGRIVGGLRRRASHVVVHRDAGACVCHRPKSRGVALRRVGGVEVLAASVAGAAVGVAIARLRAALRVARQCVMPDPASDGALLIRQGALAVGSHDMFLQQRVRRRREIGLDRAGARRACCPELQGIHGATLLRGLHVLAVEDLRGALVVAHECAVGGSVIGMH